MDSSKKRELINAYKNKEQIGGVYYIMCSGNNRKWLLSSVDLESIKHRFDFAVSIDSAFDPTMLEEWQKYGKDSFSFVVLDRIKKGTLQTPKEFADDVKALYEIWVERFKGKNNL